ncbi:hypothetical protein [Methylobacterium fujisawaense]|uniref:hypothetical protein n=1 Tax=Methylobacterium fujisawaense TaxID=107400 RepID=UPI00313C9A0E
MAKDSETALIARIVALETALDTRRSDDRDPDEVHTLAKARLVNAEAQRVELEIEALRRATGSDADAPLIASRWSVEQVTDEKGDLAVVLRLHGDGRAVEGRLSPYLAASLTGCLGQFVSEALATTKRER